MAGTIRLVKSNLLHEKRAKHKVVAKHSRYQFEKLTKIDHVLALEIPVETKADIARVQSAASSFARARKMSFSTRSTDKAVYVFRVA